MSQLDEKLNQLLGDPAAMAQVMQLAQQLSGTLGEGGGGGSPPPPPAPHRRPEPAAPPPGTNPLGALDPQLLTRMLPLMQSLTQTSGPTQQLLHRAAAVSARGKAGKAPARRSAREAYPSGKAISDGMGWRPCITGTSAAATAAIPASPSPIRPRTAHLRPRRGRICRLRRLHRRGSAAGAAHRRWICSTACSRGCTSAISTAAIC